MAELLYSARALRDLERLSDFLLDIDTVAEEETTVLIFEALGILAQHPEMGRKLQGGQRKLVISGGRTGHLALYRFLPQRDQVLVLALHHQRESGFQGQ